MPWLAYIMTSLMFLVASIILTPLRVLPGYFFLINWSFFHKIWMTSLGWYALRQLWERHAISPIFFSYNNWILLGSQLVGVRFSSMIVRRYTQSWKPYLWQWVGMTTRCMWREISVIPEIWGWLGRILSSIEVRLCNKILSCSKAKANQLTKKIQE